MPVSTMHRRISSQASKVIVKSSADLSWNAALAISQPFCPKASPPKFPAHCCHTVTPVRYVADIHGHPATSADQAAAHSIASDS